MLIYITQYFPWLHNPSAEIRRREGGVHDRRGHPLHALEDYLRGNAPWVSVARDFTGGPPGNDARFTFEGLEVRVPTVDERLPNLAKVLGARSWPPGPIPFRLVDTGGGFYDHDERIVVNGTTRVTRRHKVIRMARHEPIDICRRSTRGEYILMGPGVLEFV